MFVSLIKRLNEGSFYMSKSVSGALIPTLIPLVSNKSADELQKIFQAMVTDELPQVRKFAAQNFKDYIKVYPTVPEDQITNIFKSLMADSQDFVRIFMVDALVALVKSPLHQKNANILLSNLKQISEDGSWRIKYYFCDKIKDFVSALPKDQVKKLILP